MKLLPIWDADSAEKNRRETHSLKKAINYCKSKISMEYIPYCSQDCFTAHRRICLQ